MSHGVNRKEGDYSILVFETTKEIMKKIRPMKLASRGLEVSREVELFSSGAPRISPNKLVEIYSIFRYDFSRNEQHGSFDPSLKDAKIVVCSMKGVHGCSGGGLFLNCNNEPVIFGNCVGGLGMPNDSPADYILGTGLIRKQGKLRGC